MSENRTEEALRTGFLGRCGALSVNDAKQAAEIVEQVKADGIETVRIVFTDPHGILRGKTVTARALLDAFKSGIRVPSGLLLKDPMHITMFPVWDAAADSPMHGVGDVLLSPVPQTFRVLPWSPHSALILCDVLTTDGDPLALSTRGVLQKACDRLAERNLTALIGLEVEFQVFEVVDAALDHADTTFPPRPPTTRPLNQGYQYLSEARYDANEQLLDKIRRAAEHIGMPVRSVEIEMGPSQFEFTFDAADPLTVADMAVTFRTLVREVSQREGLLASFMAKPRLENAFASGWHIHQSIMDADGKNLFIPESKNEISQHANAWIAGLLRNAPAACIATTPTVNGYKRYTSRQLAPNRIGWANDNRGAMLRTLFQPGDSASRVENRVPESAANPYLALASQLISGFDGITQELDAPPPLTNPYDDEVQQLPSTLLAAIEAFEASPVFRDALGDQFFSYFVQLKRGEWDSYVSAISEWEHTAYFVNF